MTKFIISFCEGQHDIAFLSRILFANGFSKYNKKLKDFPYPLNNQYISRLELKKISDSTLGFKSNYIIPSVALSKDNTIALFHDLGGDGKHKERNEILNMYLNLVGNEEEDQFTSRLNMDFKFIYFFDADDKGIDARLEELNNELELSSPVQHNKILEIDGYKWGCYVFHKDPTSGELEDILIDLMIKDNESIFENCIDCLDNTSICQTRQKEFICTAESEDYKGSIKFKKKKSLISMAGQLQFSGMNNSVIISKSDYIRKSDLESNKHCLNIKELFVG